MNGTPQPPEGSDPRKPGMGGIGRGSELPETRDVSDTATGPLEAPVVPDLANTIMGDCRLIRKIAQGGMGEVYEARQLRLDRKVAVKILTRQLASHSQYIQRFEREARAAAALNHPAIVQVYDYGKADGRYYLSMEFVEGRDLSQVVREDGKLRVDTALSYIEQAVRALRAALEKSIIHRDIKPANMMLTTEGRIKVADLGLAKNLSDDVEVTATGVGIGSPLFLSPEQASDARAVDHRADIYSLGITLLFLLTGKYPFDGNTPFAIVLAHANKPLPTGAELGTPLPEHVESLIARMAAKKPEDRHADYNELLEDIARVRSGQLVANPLQAPLTETGPESSDKSFLMVAAIVALLVVAIGGATLFVVFKMMPGKTPAAKTQPVENTAVAKPAAVTEAGPVPKGMAPAAKGSVKTTSILPVVPRPDRTPLADAPFSTMMEQADAYAKANPESYIKIIDRYEQISGKNDIGPAMRASAAQKLRNAVLMHEIAISETIGDYTTRSKALLAEGKRNEAIAVWRNFPLTIRTPEVDRQIQQALDELFR
ncbi:MAG TPA: protein kinase [Roseimicrobium sp.]|nr:protein kinase [Roseimicrobium sp.]